MARHPFVTSGAAYAIVLTLLAPVADAGAAATTCNSTTSCTVIQNTGTGPAVHAQSISGPALRATSSGGPGLYAASSSGLFNDPGVEGESTATGSGDDAAGAFGVAPYIANATPPNTGVFAYGYDGVYGQTVPSSSPNRYGNFLTAGTYGMDSANPQGTAQAPDYSFGSVGASNSAGTGVFADSEPGVEASPSDPYQLWGQFPIGLYAQAYASNNGTYSVAAIMNSDYQSISAFNTSAATEFDAGGTFYLLDGYVQGGTAAFFSVDNSGDEYLAGSETIGGPLYTPSNVINVVKGVDGTKRASYGGRTTAPQVEDDGEATVVSGYGHVNIDAALHDVIDGHDGYLVFLTPEGDCNGLYVSNRSASGFEIRELRGGHSSLAVDYRIVAKPLGDREQRLAIVPERKTNVRPSFTERSVRSGSRRPRFLSPIDRLKRRLGPAGFARAVEETKLRLSQR